MGWFRRREETLNDRLLREAGYAPDGTKPEPAPPEAEPARTLGLRPLFSVQEAYQVGSLDERRPRPWDVATAVEAPDLHGDAYAFATLPDGSLIVDGSTDEDLSPLADAVEEHLPPPYRAAAVRHDESAWSVSARRIQVIALPFDADELELASIGGERTFLVDAAPTEPAVAPPELVQIGEACGADYAVHAARLDGNDWEVEADPL